MSRKTKTAHPMDKPESRVVAEETTTLPEGAVLSVYLIRIGKPGHTSTRLVALHANMNRVEMTADKITAQNLRVYLQLVRLDIERRRKLLTAKPTMDYVNPDTLKHFVESMAYNGMFILEPLSIELQQQEPDADKPKPVKKMVERRRKIQKQPQVLPDSNGAMRRGGKTAGNS